jgi:predicted naringenin-chalcone synthase
MAAILSVATALPPMRIDQDTSIAAARAMCGADAEQSQTLEALYRNSGIRTRHVVYDGAEVEFIAFGRGACESPFVPGGHERGPSTGVRMQRFEREAERLAISAAREALASAALDAQAITHLVTVSCTGMSAPGIDIALIKHLGLSLNVERTNVGFMGCHGALNGLRVARALVDGHGAHVLLCAVELCSLHNYYGWNPKRIVANALFADGAAAAVVCPDQLGSLDCWRIAASGAGIFPDTEWAMDWRIGDPGLIEEGLGCWMSSWLEANGLRRHDIASWAVHPGGPRILDAFQAALGLRDEATACSRSILDRYGNMSSATVLFILQELMRSGGGRPCVAVGFGPGLAVEASLFC